MKAMIEEKWKCMYAYIIPTSLVLSLIIMSNMNVFDMGQVCTMKLYSDMLTGVITFMSIILSIYGFLIPSLISAKNDAMVKYFIEHADMKTFTGRIKQIVLFGLLGILLSISLYYANMMKETIFIFFFCSWVWIISCFTCNAYRFISIIIELLLNEKISSKKKHVSDVTIEEINKLNDSLKKL